MKKRSIYQIFLLIVFFAFWIWAAISPAQRDTWLVENLLIFIFVPIIIFLGFYFRLSNISYTLITIFMILHLIGAHYSYSYVPFGFVLQSWLNANRNMYDRLVHLSFGLLLAYPIREVFLRVVKVKGFWGYYLPLDFTLAFSAIYELIEYSSIFFASGASVDFLGMQGDVWDTQKDMLLAFIGSIIAMFITFMINLYLQKNIWKEFKDSFKINKNDHPLGEEEIIRELKNKK